MAQNVVKVRSDGVILVKESGYQKAEDIRELNIDVAGAIEKVNLKFDQVLVLVDLSRMEGNEKGAELEAIKVLKMSFDRMAIFTTSRALKIVINTLLAFNYNRSNVRVFSSAQLAKDWLINQDTETAKLSHQL